MMWPRLAEARMEAEQAHAVSLIVSEVNKALTGELDRQRRLLSPRLAAMDAMGRMFDGMFR